jgi:hypothetical protein
MMGFNMVRDRRGRDVAPFQAQPTQWLDAQLMSASALPFTSVVPAMNMTFVRHPRPHVPSSSHIGRMIFVRGTNPSIVALLGNVTTSRR